MLDFLIENIFVAETFHQRDLINLRVAKETEWRGNLAPMKWMVKGIKIDFHFRETRDVASLFKFLEMSQAKHTTVRLFDATRENGALILEEYERCCALSSFKPENIVVADFKVRVPESLSKHALCVREMTMLPTRLVANRDFFAYLSDNSRGVVFGRYANMNRQIAIFKKTIYSISIGTHHMAVLLDDGTVRMVWLKKDSVNRLYNTGQCFVNKVEVFSAVSCGAFHTVLVRPNRSVVLAGAHLFSDLLFFNENTRVKSVSCNDSMTFIIDENDHILKVGTRLKSLGQGIKVRKKKDKKPACLFAFGQKLFVRYDDGNVEAHGDKEVDVPAVDLEGFGQVVKVVGTSTFSVAMNDKGKVIVWGTLLDGEAYRKKKPFPDNLRLIDIAATDSFIYGLTAERKLFVSSTMLDKEIDYAENYNMRVSRYIGPTDESFRGMAYGKLFYRHMFSEDQLQRNGVYGNV